MSDRELLEKQAHELGVEVAEGISDAGLMKLLEDAKRDLLEARATELKIKFPKNISSAKLVTKITAAELVSEASDDEEDHSDRFSVLCAVADGRRRAGRRWPGGLTHVAADDMTEAMLTDLAADPLFQVTPPPSE
jgi:hypothetical protein